MKKNYYSATATAAKITKVPVEVIRAGFRKGAKPTGNVLAVKVLQRFGAQFIDVGISLVQVHGEEASK